MDANEKVRLLFAYILFNTALTFSQVQKLSSVDTGRLNSIPLASHPLSTTTDHQSNSAPHPSENVINVRIQMYGKLPLSIYIHNRTANSFQNR